MWMRQMFICFMDSMVNGGSHGAVAAALTSGRVEGDRESWNLFLWLIFTGPGGHGPPPPDPLLRHSVTSYLPVTSYLSDVKKLNSWTMEEVHKNGTWYNGEVNIKITFMIIETP